jgi:hypothetical protein
MLLLRSRLASSTRCRIIDRLTGRRKSLGNGDPYENLHPRSGRGESLQVMRSGIGLLQGPGYRREASGKDFNLREMRAILRTEEKGGFMSEPIKISEYIYIAIEEFKGKYRIEQGRPGKDGKWWAERVRKYVWNDGVKSLSDKDGNLSISLGDRSTAQAVLTALLREVMRGGQPEGPPADFYPDDAPPF